jgi:hypothetical protein
MLNLAQLESQEFDNEYIKVSSISRVFFNWEEPSNGATLSSHSSSSFSELMKLKLRSKDQNCFVFVQTDSQSIPDAKLYL